MVMDPKGTNPPEYHFPRGSNLQPMVASSSELNTRENSPKLLSLPIESFTMRNQADKEQFHDRNEYYIASRSNNGNFQVTSNGPLQAYSLFMHTEPPFLPSQPCNGRGGNAELSPYLQDQTRFGNMEGNMFQECRKLEISCESARNVLVAATADSRSDGSSLSCASASALTLNRSADVFLLDEAQRGSNSRNISYLDSHKESDLGHVDVDIKNRKNLEVSDIKNLGKNLKNAVASNRPAKIADGHGQISDQSPDSLKLDENGQLVAARMAAGGGEKLWEGSLQLNSSITVSAEAYFKSGERIPDVNWTEFVEVKGKVRLEAFEKYIQDLPRSRTRGLMVVSLCWKNGSSESGLTGMKEVAKKFQAGNKVGLAKLPEGVDLYICPRSDAIITILAKYGFFRGMAAIVDNPDSLIGCVVWRKNRSLDSVAKVSGANISSSKPPTSASSSPPSEQAAEPVQSKKQTVDNEEKKAVEESVGRLEKPLPSHKSDVTKLLTPDINGGGDDDDDLPEFDFKIASTVSQTLTSRSADAQNHDKRPPPRELYHRTAPANHLSAAPTLPRPSGMPPLKRARDCESQLPLMPKVEGMPFAATFALRRRNRFDDDDMPEWQPPAPERRKESDVGKKLSSSSRSVPTKTLNSTRESSHSGLPQFQRPSSARPRSSPPTFPMASSFPFSSIPVKSPQPRPVNGLMQRGPHPSMGSNCSSLWRPPADSKPPVHRPPWNSRKL